MRAVACLMQSNSPLPLAPQASKLSHQDDTAPGKNAAAEPFATAASEAARKAISSVFGGGGDAMPTRAVTAANSRQESKDNKEDMVGNNGESSEAQGTAAVAAKRKGRETAAGAEKTMTNKAPAAPSPPANKKFREDEKNRPVHPVPFWNRTNWISGRKDGTGSRGSKSGGGGNDTASSAKDRCASECAKDSTATDGIDGGRSSESAVRWGTQEVSGSSSSSSSAVGQNATAAAGSSKRARQEGGGPVAAGANGLVGGVKVPIRYQFRAGYTNAVRRPVRMKDLL